MRERSSCGYTLLELLLVISITVTLAALAVPSALSVIDHLNTAAAARHVAGRIASARLDAVRRSTTVGLRFESADDEYAYAVYVDGNGNGLRSADVTRGIDRLLAGPERLRHSFAGTSFGLLPGVPDVDAAQGSTDGVRIGGTPFLSLTPDGSATGGTLYVHGRSSQFAVRILGATGRVRVMYFDRGVRRWISR